MRRRKQNIFSEIIHSDVWNLYEIFHENSKLNRLNSREYGAFIDLISRQPYIVKRLALSYKKYPGYRQINLPKNFRPSRKYLEDIINSRRTTRKFSGKPISIYKISKLLYYSYGINGKVPVPKDKTIIQLLRAAPSAGALYPLEIYLAVFNSTRLKAGLYHYNVLDHTLEQLKLGDFRQNLANSCMVDTMLDSANLMVIITGIFKRTTFKYHERGYRFVLMESGHLAQNLSLICEAMNLGCVLIGGFKDDELNEFLGVDGVNEAVLYPAIIGRKIALNKRKRI